MEGSMRRRTIAKDAAAPIATPDPLMDWDEDDDDQPTDPAVIAALGFDPDDLVDGDNPPETPAEPVAEPALLVKALKKATNP